MSITKSDAKVLVDALHDALQERERYESEKKSAAYAYLVDDQQYDRSLDYVTSVLNDIISSAIERS